MITKFYINPITGRMIKSSGKTFKNLKNKKKYSFEKEHCLYNVKSAKKCFSKLLKIYPDVVYPSSNFINIPKTYNGNSVKGLRVFIQDNNHIIGFVDKRGNIYRLNKSINLNDIQNKYVPTVIDYYNILPKIIKKLPKINANIQKKILHQINNIKPLKNAHVLFNHVQKDFIPINTKMSKKDHDKILNIFNDNLIKTSQKMIDIKTYPEITTPSTGPSSVISSTSPSSAISSAISSVPSSAISSTISSTPPSSTISSVISSVPSSVISSEKLSRTSSSPSIRKLSRTTSRKLSRTASAPSIKTKKPSLLKKKFELDWIDNKLMKKIFENSDKSKGIKIIENERGDIIGYTE